MGKAPCWQYKHLKDSTRVAVLQKKKNYQSAGLRDGRSAEIEGLLLHKNAAGKVTNKKRKLSHKIW
jgi:hypothetical protein